VLEQVHTDYQDLMKQALDWSGPGHERHGSAGEAGRAFLAHVLERFWRTAGI
jgi:hypothetical protein